MSAIQSTCERSIYLDHGTIQATGDSSTVVKAYRDAMQGRSGDAAPRQRLTHSGAPEVQIINFEMFGPDGVSRRNFQFGEQVRIRIELYSTRRIETPLINFGIKRSDGVIVSNFNNWFDNFKIDYLEGKCVLEGWLPPLRLISYSYEIHVLVFQRLGNYGQGELSRLRPLAAEMFGDFSIEGLPLTDQDGVFQEPARKWVFTRGSERMEYTGMTDESLARAYDGERAINETLLNATPKQI
jgi:Wzt C-terminal domain